MFRFYTLLLAVGLAFASRPAAAYSVLTHQANIDSTWERSLVPALQKRYPGGTAEELAAAKAYAYGGAILQDMGYYPFGNVLFTNLTHYVRSGDFVRSLINQSENRNDYAFALGALAHYAADVSGHPEGTNRAMASVYPDLARKFGPVITYNQAPKQHTQARICFRRGAAGQRQVPHPGLPPEIRLSGEQVGAGAGVSGNLRAGIGAGVCECGPEHCLVSFFGKPADSDGRPRRMALKRKDILKLSPGPGAATTSSALAPGSSARSSATSTSGPGSGPVSFPISFGCCPRLGRSSRLPSSCLPPKHRLFPVQFQNRDGQLPGRHCPAALRYGRRFPDPAQYRLRHRPPHARRRVPLADETYGEWLRKLAAKKFENINPSARKNILAFYNSATPKASASPQEMKEDKQRETKEALEQLRALQ
ncbi:zinc dependent phospholipase C family protein [Hymenobacter humi]|uniref:Zinc dependent phospholipase C family protein n=1 Tax=Hymenobacter humi TaxID=1411620 RepID=A0ABW2UA64_9BACT